MPIAKPVTFEQLASGQQDSQFVEVVGIVRSVTYDTAFGLYAISLATGGGRLTVYTKDLPEASAGLVDATLRVRGVCSTQFNRQRQLFAIRLLAPRPEDLVVEKPVLEDPWDVSAQDVGSLLRFAPQGTSGHRVKVEGGVTHHNPGVELFIQYGSRGLQVLSSSEIPLQVGDHVEVLGFPAQGDYTPRLEDAIYRKASRGLPPVPARVTIDEALTGFYDCRLITLEAELLDRVRQGREHVLVLASGDFIFSAHLGIEGSGDPLAGMERYSLLAVTGICLIDPGPWRAADDWRARSLRLILRSPADVTLLKAPPWWTLRKLLWIVAALLLVVLAASAWVAVLRRRVQQQTGVIRQQLQTEAALKERYRDLFENANDIVFTHDLGGRITSINRSGERLLQRGRHRLLAMSLPDLVAPDQKEGVREWLAQAVKGADLPAAEWDFITASGRRVKLELNSRLIEQPSAPVEVEVIARDITERRRLEQEVLEVGTNEQRRIGHDLHDGVCQQLVGVACLVEILGERLQEEGSRHAAEAERIGALINEATVQARGVARGLFPVRLEESGLVAALDELATGVATRFHISCTFDCPEPPSMVASEVALHLYYIAQEALLNAVKHGRAGRVRVALHPVGERFKLIVSDNGIGFHAASRSHAGMGIRIMRYRAKVIGATLDVTSQQERGTEVACLFFPAPGEKSTSTH